MKILTDSKKIEQLLTRGVDKIYPTKDALEKVLKSGKRIRLYTGWDPTTGEVHIGHTVVMRKLRQFQELGHELIFLLGTFTATLGDPTGKLSARKAMTIEETKKNAASFLKQAGKVIDFAGPNAAQIKYNHEWLSPMNLADIIKLASNFTVQQMIKRDMFTERMSVKIECPECHEFFRSRALQAFGYEFEEGTFGVKAIDAKEFCTACGYEVDFNNQQKLSGLKIIPPTPIYLNEFLYPLMQGYDSVAMDVNLEVGATDQTFNMLAGRTLMKALKNKEKFVLTVPLLTDSSGKKIGKTEGNVIGIADPPNDLYGKVMALGDDAIITVFELCTDVSLDDIEKMKKELKKGANPRDLKALLARTLVAMYHDVSAAKSAEDNFNKLFREHEAPEEIAEIKVKKDKWNIIDLLIETNLASSRSEARRLIEQGGIKVEGQTLKEIDTEVVVAKKGTIIQRGKRQFVKVVLK